MIKRILLLSMILLGYASYSYSQPVYLTAINSNQSFGGDGAWVYNSQPSGDLSLQSTIQMPSESSSWYAYNISEYNGHAYLVAGYASNNNNLYLYNIDPQTGDLTYESVVLEHHGSTDEIYSVAFNNGYAYVISSVMKNQHSIDLVKYYAVNSDGTLTYQGKITNESHPDWAILNITFNGDDAFLAGSYGPKDLNTGAAWQYKVNSNGSLTDSGNVLPPPLTGKAWLPTQVVFGANTYYMLGSYNGHRSIWSQDGSEVPMPNGIEKWSPTQMILIDGYAYVADINDYPTNTGEFWKYSINPSNGHLTFIGAVSAPAGITHWNPTSITTVN